MVFTYASSGSGCKGRDGLVVSGEHVCAYACVSVESLYSQREVVIASSKGMVYRGHGI